MTSIGRSSGSSAASLIRAVGLVPQGPVTWGTRVPCDAPGVYVIDTPELFPRAPLDHSAIASWLARVPMLRLDGIYPTAGELAERLDAFWIAGETVVYLGLAGTSVAKRVRQFYRTSLGDPRPHAGGHWLKTLAVLDRLRVWWAETDDPDTGEASLFAAFAERHGGGLVLPFANREGAGRARKPHGITGSTLDREATAQTVRHAIAERSTLTLPAAPTQGGRIAQINAALQQLACATPERQLSAVDAARELDRMGLLPDSRDRPGKPLRDKLRAGEIEHSYQESGRWWFIRCGRASR
jgi:hypothetical protein